jgi:phosphate transport system permease protein
MKQWKYVEESLSKVVMWTAFILLLAVLFLIIGSIAYKGFSSLSLDMLTKTATGGFYLGKEGGILHAIVGSFMIAGGGGIIAVIFSVPVVIFLNVYLPDNSGFASATRFFLDVMSGLPSIVCGTFCFTVMMYFGIRASLLGGIIAIGIIITPVMCRALDEIARQVPRELIDATLSLGSTRYETGFKVFSRQIFPGIVSSFLLAFGRGIGDAAAVLFTAGFTDNIPDSIFKPVASLPLAIFFQLEMPIEEVRSRAYASAFVLMIIILVISILSRLLASRYSKFKV